MVAPAIEWRESDEKELGALLVDDEEGEQLDPFIRRISPQHAPPRHLQPLIKLWERTRTERVLACVEMPPRTAKTTTGLHALAWKLNRDPTLLNAFATYADDYATSRSRIARMMTRAGGLELDRSMANLSEWRTVYGGGCIFRGYMGAWTGQGIDGVALIDDPYKDRASAESKKIRSNVIEWFADVLWTRLQPPPGSGAKPGSCIVTHCVAEGEPVLMADGSWRAIENIVPGDRVRAFEHGEFVERTVLAQRSSGSDPILAVRAGQHITRVNTRHPFLTEAGDWKRAGDLRVGDRVVAIDQAFGGEQIDPEFAWLFGFMLGDGWVTSWKRRNKARGKIYEARSWCVCVAASVYPDLNERAVAAIAKFYGKRPRLTRFGYYRLDCNWAGRQLEALGIIGGAHGKRVPDWAYRLTPELKRAMLRGYADADGHVAKRSTDTRVVASVSRDLAEDVRRLAISAGVRCGRACGSTQMVKAPHSKEASPSTMWKVTLNFAKPPDRIVAIDDISIERERMVYDLTIDGAENFIAGGFVVHNTRWHTDDLIGWLLSGKFAGYRFEEIKLPAICDADDDPLGRAIGEPLWPERFPADELKRIEVSIGPYSWASLYQQAPRPKGADVFSEPARYFLDPRKDPNPDPKQKFSWQGKRILLCCDPAATDDTRSDFSAVFVLAAEGYGDDMKVWIVFGWRDHVSIPDLCEVLYSLQQRYWKAPIAVEAVGGFKAVPQMLQKIDARLRVRPVRPVGDKFTRAQPLAAAWNAGRVFVPFDAHIVKRNDVEVKRWTGERATTWADELIDEASVFTGVNDAEDDQIDSLSHGFNEIRGARIVKRGAQRNRAPFG